MPEKHTILGGKVHVYRRDNSSLWQCSTYLAGKNRRVSTKEDGLAKAKDFAEDWYLELRGKNRAKLLRVGKTFKEASEQFLREYHAEGTIRTPIEEIADFKCDLDIIPLPGLRDLLEIDGFISSDLEVN